MKRAAHIYGPPVTALILALVTVSSADVIRKWWEGAGPAVEWEGVEVLTKTVRPGGQLEMVYTAVINRQCPSELRGFVVAPDGTVPIRFPVVAGGYTVPSEDPVRIRVSITMPHQSDPGLAPLRSGPHIYRTLVTRYCPSGIENDSAVPDARFFLEAAP